MGIGYEQNISASNFLEKCPLYSNATDIELTEINLPPIYVSWTGPETDSNSAEVIARNFEKS